ncbi:CHY zinc finger protein [Salibacterium qingdaonense]|uniref:Uncharacterized protein, contains Zn-finger domain of CHY type n=1 Tax=Salibacterium qingdaonense TaxID=266892 RepID=A0A1I4K2U9_9BACI|nr:hypothetical protein [Salibacterium qingdaonense]SFL72833.1 Uncharacterized protein, contains Zn-finger domain of CHY type [Salibacterium qingdaonense]
MKIMIKDDVVYGINMDHETRCTHYHEHHDVIAVKCYCCKSYYCCYECHKELCGAPPKRWPQDEFHLEAVLCGICAAHLSIRDYLESGYQCPSCSAPFNPGCRYHYSLYFE